MSKEASSANTSRLWPTVMTADGSFDLLDESDKQILIVDDEEVGRVGSNRSQRLDVRVIAASNRDVEKEIEAGRFRQDLFYRLNAVTIYLPPLRERREDIFPLASSFAERVLALNPSVRFSPEALELLEQYSWPGNIRELENAVVRAVALCTNIVRPEDLPDNIRNYRLPAGAGAQGTAASSIQPPEEWPTLSEVEGRYVARVLEHTQGNKQAAARLLDVDSKTLVRMIKRHKIELQKKILTSRQGQDD